MSALNRTRTEDPIYHVTLMRSRRPPDDVGLHGGAAQERPTGEYSPARLLLPGGRGRPTLQLSYFDLSTAIRKPTVVGNIDLVCL